MTTGKPAARNWRREIERARKLVGLDADQPDKPATRGADPAHNAFDVDGGVAFVVGLDGNLDIGTEDAVGGALRDQAIDAGKAVRRNAGAKPLDDVAVIIVMRRLDQDGKKRPPRLPIRHNNTPNGSGSIARIALPA